MDISNYIEDGFEKACDVRLDYWRKDHWDYEHVNADFVGSKHRSWIYFIVVDDEIVKCGESGNPLILRSNRDTWKKGTTSRLGRYINGDRTDEVIREELNQEVIDGRVSIYAKKLPIIRKRMTVAGKNFVVESSTHKDLEMAYLDHFVEVHGGLPRLNKLRK